MSNVITVDEAIRELQQAEQKFVDLFIERVKQKTPVLTGTLRDGWEGKIFNGSYEFSNPANYTASVEYGTEKQSPVGMLSSTLQETEQIMDQALQGTRLK